MQPTLELLEDRCQPSVWQHTPITWSLNGLDNGWGQRTAAEVRQAVEQALATWEAAAPALDFQEVTGSSADIDIHLEPIDGPGYSTFWGYAYYPPNGRISLDSADSLTLEQLDWITDHEIGHALDLRHTNSQIDVMYPYYRGVLELSAADKQAIQSLYPTSQTPQDPVTPGNPNKPTKPYDPWKAHYAYLSSYYSWLADYYRPWEWYYQGWPAYYESLSAYYLDLSM